MFSFLLIVCNKALHECLVVLFILASFFSISQTERIESTKLDSLIWKKINEYRVTKGAKAFVVFEDSLMRDFCTRVAKRNFEKEIPLHSDSVGYWSNAECLYYYAASGFSSYEIITKIDNGNFVDLAEKAVQAWIHSPTHERLISRPEYNIATIVSIISFDHKKGEIRFDATFHALDRDHNTFNKYVYPLPKKGKF